MRNREYVTADQIAGVTPLERTAAKRRAMKDFLVYGLLVALVSLAAFLILPDLARLLKGIF
jgi:hypothetical protein